jgi:FdhD protein
MYSATRPARILRQSASPGESEERDDPVVVEAPLEIVLRYPKGVGGSLVDFPLTVTLRTPGRDEALITGLLFAEGILSSVDELSRIDLDRAPNQALVELKERPPGDLRERRRSFLSASSCGFCGKTQLGDLLPRRPPDFDVEAPHFPASIVRELPLRLREAQGQFELTGGSHAAAIFDSEGSCHGLEEDIGRHNAVDKLIGAALLRAAEKRKSADFSKHLLLLSGRVSYELIQKALGAGFPIVAAIGAPSSLAVEMANASRQTLIGFLKADRFNLYSHPQRIVE